MHLSPNLLQLLFLHMHLLQHLYLRWHLLLHQQSSLVSKRVLCTVLLHLEPPIRNVPFKEPPLLTTLPSSFNQQLL